MNKPTHISDLTPDPNNTRAHTPRNLGEIGESLASVGAARSIVIDEDGRILAGNGLIEAAAERGITKIETVDADGETIVAVRRTGLTEAQKSELSIRDNRTGEAAGWNVDMLHSVTQDFDLDLRDMGWNDGELDELLTPPDSDIVPGDMPVEVSGEHVKITLKIQRDTWTEREEALRDALSALAERHGLDINWPR